MKAYYLLDDGDILEKGDEQWSYVTMEWKEVHNGGIKYKYLKKHMPPIRRHLCLEQLKKDNEILQKKYANAVIAKKYLEHRRSCDLNFHFGVDCTCGLDKLLED